MNKIFCGNALDILKTLPSESVDMCVTSPPPYGLRDYGVEAQIGNEQTPYGLYYCIGQMSAAVLQTKILWVSDK